MNDISKRLRLPTAKEILSSKANLDFCNGETWWVTNEEETALPEPQSAGYNSCVPDTGNLFTPCGIRLMLILPLKQNNEYKLNDTYIFGESKGFPVVWVYIGKRRFITYNVIGRFPFTAEKPCLSYKESVIKFKIDFLALKMFSKAEIESISQGTFEKYLIPHTIDGVLHIDASVDEIPDGAYLGADYIKRIVIDERTTPLRIGDYAFCKTRCKSVEGLEYCTSIGFAAFSYADLSGTIRIGNCKIVSDCAFANNDLTRVEFQNFMYKIGLSAFYGNCISDVTFGDNDKHNDVYIVEIDDKAFCGNHLSKDTIDIIKDRTIVQYYESSFADQEIAE
jgi:hypothetical protein